MDAEQARRVLGLQSDDDWTLHEAAFLATRQHMAELVRQSPTDAMAQRYQDGLMEFDRALAFFREQNHSAPDRISVEPKKKTFDFEVEDLTMPAPRPRRTGWLFLSVFMIIGIAFAGLYEWQRQQEAQRQMQVAQWEGEAADHLSKRRWQDALAVYQKIEVLEGNSNIAIKGRRSIEAGMVEEQEQYLGYWSGAAIAASEASQWAEASAAIAKVLEMQPRHEEMIALAEKVQTMETAKLRQQWRDHALAAMDQRQWAAALPWIQKMVEAEPQSETALAWKVTAELGIKTEIENKREATQLYQQALALDQGVYNPQLLDRIDRAKKLAPDDSSILALYEKVASYGRTIRVPQEFPDLQKALDGARDHDRVVLEPGTYVGSFSIKAAVILEAASGEVILSCAAESGPALTIHKVAQGAKISGLQFHHTTLLADAERYSTVLVSGAKASFDRCRFYRAAGHGMAVIQGGDVSVDQCRFEENGWDGISVQDAQSHAQIRNSVFVGNIHHGIEVWNQAAAVVESNRCADNCLNGILIDTTAVVTVQTNQLNGNREYGIFIRTASGGSVAGNRIANNLLGGMAIAPSAKAVSCQQNVFGKNEGAALLLGKGLFSSSFSKNQFPGLIEKSVVTDVPME